MSKEEIDPNIKKKKWSFWGIGLLIFAALYIALMFILEAVLQPRESFTATIIAYVLGIVALVVFAALVRDKSKVLISVPILLIIVFGAGYLFNYVAEAPVYNPLAPLSERTETVVTTLQSLNETSLVNVVPFLNDTTIMDNIVEYSPLSFAVDLVLALPLFIFGTIGITWLVQILTSTLKLMSLLSGFFAALFIVLGLVLTPMFHLLISGFGVMAADVFPGVLYLMEAFPTFTDFGNMTQTDINLAVDAFNNASLYFEAGADSLQALQKSGIIGIAGIIPVFGSLVENLYWMSIALLHFSPAVGPFLNGTFYIMDGLQDAMDVLGGGFPMPLAVDGDTEVKMNAFNDTVFDEAIATVEEGLDIMGNSTEGIEQALADLSNVSIIDIGTDIGKIPFMPENVTSTVVHYLELVDGYVSLFEGAVTAIYTLLEEPEIEGIPSGDPTLIHFLYGARSFYQAAANVGDSTNFTGTIEHFENAYGNFSAVSSQLHKPEIENIADSDTPFMNSTLSFLIDLGDVVVAVSALGLEFATAFVDLQDELDVFNSLDYEDISDYPTLISDILAVKTTVNGLASNATTVDFEVQEMNNSAYNGTYDFLTDPAINFVDMFSEFDFVEFILDIEVMVDSLYYMILGLEDLTATFDSIIAGQTAFTSLDYTGAINNFTNANTTLHASIGHFNDSIDEMDDAVNVRGMSQLSSSLSALTIIRDGLLAITDDVDDIITLTIADPVANAGAIIIALGNITTALDQVNIDLQGVGLT